MLRKVKVLQCADCRAILQLEAALSGRKTDRRVLATDVDAELVESDRPDGGPRQSGGTHGFLIPVNDVGVVVDEVKTQENAENSGTPRSDTVCGWDDFGETHKESLEYVELCEEWCAREKCAHACER